MGYIGRISFQSCYIANIIERNSNLPILGPAQAPPGPQKRPSTARRPSRKSRGAHGASRPSPHQARSPAPRFLRRLVVFVFDAKFMLACKQILEPGQAPQVRQKRPSTARRLSRRSRGAHGATRPSPHHVKKFLLLPTYQHRNFGPFWDQKRRSGRQTLEVSYPSSFVSHFQKLSLRAFERARFPLSFLGMHGF